MKHTNIYSLISLRSMKNGRFEYRLNNGMFGLVKKKTREEAQKYIDDMLAKINKRHRAGFFGKDDKTKRRRSLFNRQGGKQ